MSRKTIPYSTFDDLEPGEEIRVKRLGMSHISGVFEGFHLDKDGTAWLKLALPKSLIWIWLHDVQWSKGMPMLQRIKHTPRKHDNAVLCSILEGDSRVVRV